MSGQSGIGISSGLEGQFREFQVSGDRILVVKIDNEAGEMEHRLDGSSSLEKDLTSAAAKIGPTNARYIIFRDENGLVFATFVPDAEKVRSKMLYASSSQNIHKQLGGSSTFHTNIFWTEHSEISLKGWQEHIDHQRADAPMTEEEIALRTAVDHEVHRMGSARASSGLTSSGVFFELAPAVNSALDELWEASDSRLVLLGVSSKEQIEVVETHNLQGVSQLQKYFPEHTPRYGVLAHDGKTIFIYVVPDGATVKDRMMYASTRVSLLNHLKSLREIDQVIETSEPDEITVGPLSAPSEEEPSAPSRPRFARPKRPGR